MALTDGDPRVAAKDLYASVTRLERRFAEEAFAERLKLAGRNDPQYPDDESAARVAAEAMRSSARRLASRTALAAWTIFSALAVATLVWPGIRGPFMLSVFLSALAASGCALLWVGWRSSQVRRWLHTQAQVSPTPSVAVSSLSSTMPATARGRLGPRQLAPVPMERVTRVEAALVEGFFPGEGHLGTGRPSWDGGPRDRVRLRRCFYGSALMVAGVGGILGSLLLDTLGSWVASGFDDDSEPSGVFLLGWFASIAWLIRRGGQLRRWYRCGVGREVELARRAVPVPAPEGPRRASPRATRAWVVAVACTSVFLVGTGVWGVDAELDARAQTQPFAEGVVTTGTVVKVHSDDGRTFRAQSRFTDSNGQPHTVTSLSGNDRARVGDEVEVSYRPSDPTDARDLTTNADAWKVPLGTFAFVSAIGLIGIGMLLVLFVKGPLRRKG